MEKLIIAGTGLLSTEIVEFVECYQLYDIIGFTVNANWIESAEYLSRPVFPLEELDKIVDKNEVKVFVAMHWYNYFNRFKRQKFDELRKMGFHFANLISPSAVVRTKDLGEGNWIEDLACIESHTVVGDNNIFRTASLLSHHSTIGSHNVLVGRACISGSCNIGDNNYFGINSLVFNELSIGNKNIIGGGTILKHSLTDFNIIISDESHCETSSEKKVEFLLSPTGLKLTKLSNG